MIMKNTITSAIRGGIHEKNDANNIFTAKQYLASVEEQFKVLLRLMQVLS